MLATGSQPEPSANAPCTRTTFLIFCVMIVLLSSLGFSESWIKPRTRIGNYRERFGGTSDPHRPYATYRSWHRHLDHSCKRLDITRSDRKRNTNCARSPKAGVTAGHLLVRGDRS